jgi:excisionase family DNA binding protein
MVGVRSGALLSVAEVACRLSVCEATVYKLCSRGDLEHVRILNAVRITPAALDAFARAVAGPRTTRSQPRAPDGEESHGRPQGRSTGE